MFWLLGHLFSAPPHVPMGAFSYNPSSMLHHHPGSAAAALAAVRPGVQAIPGLKAELAALEQRVAACPCASQRQDGGDDL